MTTEAEPMDLSDIAVADFIDRARREGTGVGIYAMAPLIRAAFAIRDAATAAERERAAALCEMLSAQCQSGVDTTERERVLIEAAWRCWQRYGLELDTAVYWLLGRAAARSCRLLAIEPGGHTHHRLWLSVRGEYRGYVRVVYSPRYRRVVTVLPLGAPPP